MSELLSLPPGDPEEGFVVPIKDETVTAGTLAPDEKTWIDDGVAQRQDEYDRVTTAEHDVAVQRAADQEALVGAMRVSSIFPTWCRVVDPPFELHVYGSNFTMSTKIVFGGNDNEPITFYSEGHISTGVTTSLFSPDFVRVSARETSVGEEADAIGECLFQFIA